MRILGVNVRQQIDSKWITILFAVCFVTLTILKTAHTGFKLPDFAAGYSAVKSVQTNQLVYDITHTIKNRFDLSPPTLLFYAPFANIEYHSAAVIFFVITLIAIIYAIITIQRIVRMQFRESNFPIIPLIIISPLIFRELIAGSIAPVMLFCFTLSLDMLLKRRKITAGIILGILFLLEPPAVILLIPLLICHRWRTLVPFLITAIFGWVALIPFCAGQINAGTTVLDWYAVISENGIFSGANFSVASILYGTGHFSFVLLGLILLILTAVIVNPIWFQFRTEPENRRAIALMMITLWAVPSILANYDETSFVSSIPLVFLMVQNISTANHLWKRIVAITLSLLFLIAAIWGESSHLYTIATLLMIVTMPFFLTIPANENQ